MDHQKHSTETSNIANRRRSERVMLKVPVVLSTHSADGIVTEEKTSTQVVNAHGGLLGLQMEISVGQLFLLTNSKTGIARECTVVRTQESPSAPGRLVAFQFTAPTPDFWPIVFPPKDWQSLESEIAVQKK
jgi:hypothetical protein